MSAVVARRGTRRSPVDSPGADVGERLHAVHVTLVISGHVPNHKMRRRGDRLYPREDLPVYRSYIMAFPGELFEPGRKRDLALAIARAFLRDGGEDDWPPEPRRRKERANGA